ncbi:peroxiredoxin, Ohr subfamily [Arboricoccus pini]|uniref:Peroxiredoxin, Ohr subfamily n=1 Tax=Arboricoccus pini TaxID=1963835 RepID=A0A212QN19_9PROT|nr:organic hydroperoxide resistance protein [Arboricoccus pini]SNB60745.1 peroxiredoxin, Ohr subfamily [Arboricoccus pini]
MEILYTATATSKGGRDGGAKTSDGKLDLALSVPKAMGGDDGPGTNPEQLFACGYAACFLGALKAVAGKEKIKVSNDTTVTAKVHFGKKEPGFGLAVELEINIPGIDKAQAEDLVKKAHEFCPYSRATRNNIDVKLTVV